jgi:5-methyltetrahydrofolate--homocysteine methyltransferase
MIGGAPITQNYAEQIGADGYSPDAASAAEDAKKFVI